MPALLTRMSSLPNAFFVSANRRLDVGLFGDVGLHGDGLAALAGDFGDDPLGVFRAAGVIDHDRGPLGRQMLGDRRTDALRRPRDDRDFSRKFRHGSPFTLVSELDWGILEREESSRQVLTWS